MDKNSLTHHGVKGMRWGIRRFRNKDGSLTTAGKRRRADVPEEKISEDHKKIQGKSAKEMNNDELRVAMNRAQMEKQYAALTQKEKSAGRKLVEGILMDSAKQMAVPLITKYGIKGVDKIVDVSVKKANAKKNAEAAKEAAEALQKVTDLAGGMSNDDLKAAILRKNLEQQYIKLYNKR